ncbi:MAG: hypothetical protein MRY21_07490 [Simkaniaceae bacterium]|nr:hypothetical protein [Simkaniaceae bacterium]
MEPIVTFNYRDFRGGMHVRLMERAPLKCLQEVFNIAVGKALFEGEVAHEILDDLKQLQISPLVFIRTDTHRTVNGQMILRDLLDGREQMAFDVSKLSLYHKPER